jgi:hypothetical protein
VQDLREILALRPLDDTILCDFFREVCGNPFRPVAASLFWRTPAVVALSRGIYGEAPPEGRSLRVPPVSPFPCWPVSDGRPLCTGDVYHKSRFADLPILGDALEEAGCTEEAILQHCRRPGPHFRGCWVLDLLLGWR